MPCTVNRKMIKLCQLHQVLAPVICFKDYSKIFASLFTNKKHLKNVGPIRHCEPPHAACFTLPFTRCRYCRTPPAHRYPQQHRQQRQRQQRQRVTEGTAMVPWNRPKKYNIQTTPTTHTSILTGFIYGVYPGWAMYQK